KAVANDRMIAAAIDLGGISVYEKDSRHLLRWIDTSGAVQDLQIGDGYLIWVGMDSKTLHAVNLQTGAQEQYEVSGSVLRGSIQRLGFWRGSFVVHGETEFAFINPTTKMVRRAFDVLPKEVFEIAKQGPVQTVSRDGTNLLISIRRAGFRKTTSHEQISDIAMVNAWTVDGGGEMRLLGGYTCSLVKFRDADGPKVRVEMGKRVVESKFGTGSLSNMKLGPEGLIGMGLDEAFVVPFFQDSWLPDRIKTAFKPRYAQSMDYSQESAWWTDGAKAYRTDLADGSTDAYLPKGREEIRSVLSDADGAYLLTNQGIRRIDLDAANTEFTRVSAAASTEPGYREQLILQRLAQKAVLGKLGNQDSLASILIAAGAGKDCMTSVRRVDEAELGDLVKWENNQGIYMGEGRILVREAGSIGYRDLQPTEDMRFYRVLPRNEITAADLNPVQPKPANNPTYQPTYTRPTAPAQPGVNPEEIFPVGVNGPKTSLGHSLFVRCVPGAPFDTPQSLAQRKLLEVAQGWLGVPYRWGGNTKSGVDCSGFVTAVFRELGINLPRHSQDIGRARFGKVVKGELHFGDVLVFQAPKHVAIYIGNGQTIESKSGGVGISTVRRRTQAIVRRFL
ncbi:MAG TPA: NlpC/P60 family protein, partial [Fimbriimonas sp.]|nr:NlpC/P60 family protein [Fimbriimonas sp.]